MGQGFPEVSRPENGWGRASHRAGLSAQKDPKVRLLTFSTHEVTHAVTRDTMTGLERDKDIIQLKTGGRPHCLVCTYEFYSSRIL